MKKVAVKAAANIIKISRAEKKKNNLSEKIYNRYYQIDYLFSDCWVTKIKKEIKLSFNEINFSLRKFRDKVKIST